MSSFAGHSFITKRTLTLTLTLTQTLPLTLSLTLTLTLTLAMLTLTRLLDMQRLLVHTPVARAALACAPHPNP